MPLRVERGNLVIREGRTPRFELNSDSGNDVLAYVSHDFGREMFRSKQSDCSCFIEAASHRSDLVGPETGDGED